MVRDYELMYIVRPELDDEALRATVKSVRGIVEAQGGEIVKTTLWGKRRLAYEVQRLRDGHYVLVALHLDGAKVGEVERALRIHDTVFRHLIVRKPEPSRKTAALVRKRAANAAAAEAEAAAAAAARSPVAYSNGNIVRTGAGATNGGRRARLNCRRVRSL